MLFEVFWEIPEDLIAIEAKGNSQSYGDLRKNVLLAAQFIEKNGSTEEVVILDLEDPFWNIAFFWACIFTGRSQMPISSKWPVSRRDQLLQSMGKKLLINPEVILRLTGQVTLAGKKLDFQGSPHKIFSYVATSGSTGISKIAMISFSNWISFVEGFLPNFKIEKDQRIISSFEKVFDPSFAMIALAHLNGARLNLFDLNHPLTLIEHLQKNPCIIWSGVPSLARANLHRMTTSIDQSGPEKSFFTGEKLDSDLVLNWRKRFPSTEVFNLYGPVETCVWVSFDRVPIKVTDPISIGQPFGMNIFEVDQGELIIRGPQVFVGYLGKEKKIESIYRTGDLIEYKEGKYYWRGRKDRQIKIFGQRVQIDDLEAFIFEEIGLFCNLIWDEEQKIFSLVGENPDLRFEEKSLSLQIEKLLPPQLRPRKIKLISELPRSVNGKLDRQKIEKMISERG